MHFVWFFLLGLVAVFYVVGTGVLCGVAWEGGDDDLTGNECLGVCLLGTMLLSVCLVLLTLTGLSNIVAVCAILGAMWTLLVEVHIGWVKITSGERYARSVYVGRVAWVMVAAFVIVTVSVLFTGATW